MSKFSLKQKIVWATISVGLVMGLIMVFFIFFYLRDTLVEQKVQEINQLNIEQSHETNEIFHKHQLFAKMLASNILVQEYLVDLSASRKSQVDKMFADYAQKYREYLSIFLLDKEGNTLISTDQRFVGVDYSFRDYFQQVKSGKSWVDILLGKTSNQFGYYFSEPVFDERGVVVGNLVAKLNIDSINQSIDDSEVSKNSTIMMTDRYGVIVYSGKEERFLKSLGDLSADEISAIDNSDKFLGQKIEPLHYNVIQDLLRHNLDAQALRLDDRIDGDREVVGFAKLQDFPFYLVTETSLAKIENAVFNTIMFLVIIIFLLVALLIALMYRLISIFIRPLEKLKYFVEKISAGDFSQKVDISSGDEFSDLATVFNKMSKDLNDLYKNLDKKVQTKTLEVELKNKDLDQQKIALLNVLEDMEHEKNKVASLVQDLEKFQLAVENASDHIVITDAAGFILYANKSVERITGFSIKEVVGKKAGSKELWGGLMSEEFYKNFWHTIKHQKKAFIGELQNRRKNGEVYDSMASVSPILSKSGEVAYFIGIERDISKEKQIDKAKSEFVSLASHQLRTPLAAINWYAEMLLNGDAGKLKTEQIEYIKEIFDGNQRMIDLVNALLNVSRIELGTLAIDSAPTDIKELADSVLNELAPQLLQKKQKVSKKYAKNLPKINLDAKIMRIVWQNFLSNAVKYTPDGGKITVSIAVSGKDMLIGVADTGYGIPADQQSKIFTKLFRADNIRDKITDGTGLGLYICKSVIEQFGGKVWFESVENKGTTFYAKLPLKGVAKKEGSKGLNYNK